jgi:hypothetical protein
MTGDKLAAAQTVPVTPPRQLSQVQASLDRPALHSSLPAAAAVMMIACSLNPQTLVHHPAVGCLWTAAAAVQQRTRIVPTLLRYAEGTIKSGNKTS